MAESGQNEIITSINELHRVRQKIGAMIGGMEDQLETSRKAIFGVESRIEALEKKLDEIDKLMAKMDEFTESKGILSIGEGSKFDTGKKLSPEQMKSLKEEAHGYARLAREIYEEMEELEEMTEEAVRETHEQSVVLKEVLHIENQIERYNEQMAHMDKTVNELMKKFNV